MVRNIFTILFVLNSICMSSQSSEDLIDSFQNYSSAPRELVYTHLNKTVYIKGESLGFTAYVFDKSDHQLSKLTKNLYCTISKDDKVIKKKLIKVNDGIASNVFQIDSLMDSGVFTFKAYTNWMRNFDEINHFEQTFSVIDPKVTEVIEPIKPEELKIDLQVLGEGGSIVFDIPNTLGIIAKNQFGLGVRNGQGSIIDDKNNTISNFKLNKYGLSKTVFIPEYGSKYYVKLEIEEKDIIKEIEDIKISGLTMNLKELDGNVLIALEANKNFLTTYGNENFKIAIHNGDELKVTDFNFNKNQQLLIRYSKSDLYDGMNIFTVFNKNNHPLLERLYLNMDNVEIKELNKIKVTGLKDSLKISLQANKEVLSGKSNISVSILPSETQCYNQPNNILSQIYLRPYIRGAIEDGYQYFKNTTKSKYDLDLLLITQGWSSYNWNSIFEDKDLPYTFEQGINITANVNNNKFGNYIFYPISENHTEIFEINSSNKAFNISEIFPNENDAIRIAYLNPKTNTFKEKPSLYLQFQPMNVPELDINLQTIKNIPNRLYTSLSLKVEDTPLSDTTIQLDQVELEGNIKKSKIKELQDKAIIARYVEIEENVKHTGMRVDTYLQRLGYRTYYDIFSGKVEIYNPRVMMKDSVPLVYLDGMLLTTAGVNSDFGILTFLTMNDVDYIEYEPYGIGGGLRGSAGYIKIFTSDKLGPTPSQNQLATFDLPLKFSNQKQYYSPKYHDFNSDFFKEYGTIDWIPNLIFNDKGEIDFNIFDTKNNLTLYIEGVLPDGSLISQQKKIEIHYN